MAIISAQNQAEVAQLEHEILDQESSKGTTSNDVIWSVNIRSPSLKRYVVPSLNAVTEAESKDSLEGIVYTQIHTWIDNLSSMDNPHFVQF